MEYKKSPCTWNGIAYDSHAEAVEAIGITRRAMTMRLYRGKTCDDDMRQHNGKRIRVGGVTYPSIRQAARELNYSTGGIHYWLRSGKAEYIEEGAA